MATKIRIYHKHNNRETTIDLDSVIAVEEQAEPRSLNTYCDSASKDFHERREYTFKMRGGKELKFYGRTGRALQDLYNKGAIELKY